MKANKGLSSSFEAINRKNVECPAPRTHLSYPLKGNREQVLF
jgi:hypothetical protein